MPDEQATHQSTADTRSRSVAESARGLDAIAECDSIAPVYQSIAERAAATMRAMKRERALLRGALRDLIAWGRVVPAPNNSTHFRAGWAAFDKAKRALNGKR